MKYPTAGAFRTALERRLLTIARETETPVVRLRKLVVFDRLMARLLVVANDRWILKGAVALNLREGVHFRTTKDMDLARYDDEQAATADLLAGGRIDLGDYFRFAIERTAKLDAAIESAAVRYHVRAELAGRTFEDVLVDIGFADARVADTDILRGSDLLTFAGIAPIEVPVLPLEQHVAEKVHAYTRTYSGGRHSTRVKDLIDLVLMSSHFAYQAGRLRGALTATFEARGAPGLPASMPPPPHDWGVAYRRMAIEVRQIADVQVGYGSAAAFLNPILANVVPDVAVWDPERGAWQERHAVD